MAIGPVVPLLLLFVVFGGGKRRARGRQGPHPFPPATVPEPTPGLPEPGPKAGGYTQTSGAGLPVTTQLEAGQGYVVKNPAKAFGTFDTVTSLRNAIALFQQCVGEMLLAEYTVRVADISKAGGGKLPPHLSHREGRDVDVSIQGQGAKLPLEILPCLLTVFLSDPNTAAIFLDWTTQGEVWAAVEGGPFENLRQELQWPLKPKTGRTRVRHSKGHANHIHVRFAA